MTLDGQMAFGEGGAVVSTYLYTNRYNLLDFLSSDLIKPACLIQKYRTDIGARAPGHLVLWRAPLASAVVTPENEDEFPVALEIQLSLGAEAQTLQTLASDGRLGAEPATLIQYSSSLALLLPGPLPLSTLKAIHFRTSRELEEFTARRFEDTLEFPGPLLVSPELLIGDTGAACPLPEAFQSFPSAEELRSWYDRSERFLGAFSMVLSDTAFTTMMQSPGATTAIVWAPALGPSRTPSEVLGFRDQLGELSLESPGESIWLPLVPHLLSSLSRGETPEAVVKATLKNVPAKGKPPLAVADLTLLAAVLDVVAKHDAKQTGPDQLLKAIEDRFLACFASTFGRVKNAEDIRQRYTKAFGVIREIRQGERDIGIISHWPAGREVLKSLLLFILKPEASRTVKWASEPEKHLVSPGDLALTLLFSGLFQGLRRLPQTLRPTGLGARVFERILAVQLSQVQPFQSASDRGARAPELRLSQGGSLTDEGVESLRTIDLGDGLSIESRSLDRLLGGLDALRDLSSAAAKKFAPILAEQMGWEEVFSQVLKLTGVPYSLESNGKQVGLRLDRAVEFQREFNETLFKKKASIVNLEQIPVTLRADFAKISGREIPKMGENSVRDDNSSTHPTLR